VPASPPAGGPQWSIYWDVEDAPKALERVAELGGRVTQDIHETPYGQLAGAADPYGAEFKLRTMPG
jgi:hypothetical protein